MKFRKKMMFICFILIMLISISAVTAADDNINSISSHNAVDELSAINNDNDEILNATDSGTFQALNTKVNSGSAVITLENDYTYTTAYNSGYGVAINNANTVIDGNGFTIDGKGQSRMFQISVEGVTLKNIRFVNGLATYIGGAIYFSKDVTFINCTFINNVVTGSAGGGAIYGSGVNDAKANIYNCTFINNSFTYSTSKPYGGGAISFRGVSLNIDNCTFENNSAPNSYGGAIYVYASRDGFSITNSNFTNNKASTGGAIFIYSQSYGTDVLLSRNIYLNNTITGTGGSAIQIESMGNINITDSIFINPKTQVYVSNPGYTTANYNWWGNTFDNYTARPAASNVNMLNWYYLDMPYSYKYSTVNVSLNNLYTTSPAGTSKHQSKLPTVTFNLSAVDATIDDNVTLVNGEATVSFVRSEPIAYITASYETSSYTKQITEILGDFQTLQNLVDDESLSVIELDRDYNYTIDLDTMTTGVKVTRDNLVIDGKGFTIDAQGMSRIFEIRANDITLKNINFINGKCTHAGSVYFNGNGIRFINCNFTDSESTSNPGGALYLVSTDDVNFDDCSFINCTSYSTGGAIFLFTYDGLNYNFNRCVFLDNYANTYGDDIFTSSYGTLNVNNSIFINSVDDSDYAIYPNGGKITCNIDNNWWGNTADNYDQTPINGLTINTWYYLDVIPSSTGKTIEISLKKYNSIDAIYNLPPLTLNVQGVNLTVGQSKVTLDENGKATISYSNPVSETGSVTVSYRNIELTKDLNLVMGDFDKLNALISTATSSLIELNRDYNYTVGVDEITDGIEIYNEDLVIDGKGHTIDAQGMSRIFTHYGYNVTFKNITFLNGKESYGGAFYVYGDVLYIDNCTFINNTATGSYGGAFYAAHDYYMAITNSKFINNTAYYYGGALYLKEYESGGRTDVINTTFIGNKANRGYGGAIYSNGRSGTKENIVGCTFVDNIATSSGSAIYHNAYSSTQNTRASIFLNNTGTIIDSYYADKAIANNNWFGNTYDNMSDKPNVGSNVNMTKWLYFDVIPNSDSTLTVSINNVYDNETGKTSTYSTNYMPSINVTLRGENINLDETEVTLDNHGKAVVGFTLTDDASVTGKYYGDIQVTKEITYGPFARLQDLIRNTPDNSVIELTRDYVWGPGDTITNGIVFYDKKNITIIGNGHKVDAAGHSRVFLIDEESTDITLKDLYIINGYKNYDDGQTTQGFDGAGLVNLGVNTKLINCTFFNNTAKSLVGGGAVYWSGDYGSIINCTFENNTQLGQDGGAIYLEAEHVDIENTEFINNTAKGPLGGGAMFIRTGNNQIVNCSFYDNTAKAGGAIREYYDTDKTKIINSTFIGNVATSTEYGGGAIMGNDPQVYNSVFFDNEAQYGAAVYADFDATIDKSVFINNTARGSSIIFLGNYGNVTNSIFLNNSPEIGYIISNPWANATADYNWYGNTDKNFNQTPWVSNLVNMTKWIFLNATTPTFDGDNNNFTTKFNLMVYDSETQTAENFDSNRLQAFDLTLSSQNLTLAENNAIIGEDVEANMTYYTGYLKAQYEDVEYIIPFKYQLPSWIEAEPVTVNVTKTKKLNFTVYPFDESTDFLVERGRVTFEVEDPSIASIEIKNMYFVYVKGLKVGVTNITIKFNGLDVMGKDMYFPSNATITVNVTLMPTKISLIDDMPEKLYVSDSGNWIASLSPSGASGITFTSSNPDILNITSYGSSSCYYKAKQEGKVNVTISYAGTEEYAPCSLVYEIEVVKKDTYIEVENEYIELNISQTHWSYATLQPLNSHNLNYTSNNSDVATVTKDGNSFKINPLSVGIANITISYAGNDVYKPCEAYVIVNVTGVETHFEVNSTIAVNVSQGKSMGAKLVDQYGNQQIFPDKVTYTSNDTSIITVDESGYLKGIKEGVVNITIEFAGKEKYLPTKAYVIVTSSKVDTRIEVNETIDVFVDNTTTVINVKVIDEYGNAVNVWPSNPINYTSNDTDVVVISTSGRIYPQKEGVAKVNVTFCDVNQYRSSNATVIINVKRHASDIDVADVVEMYVTDTVNLNASVVKTGTIKPAVNYTSNDTSVVEIIGTNGNIKAKGVGIANITVNFTGDRLNLPCVKYVKVIVTQIETSIEVIGNQDLKVGDEGNLQANLTPDDAGSLKYTSSNTSVVTVDSEGNFIAVGEGTANITVETDLSDKYTKSVEYVIFNVTRIATSIDVNETFDIFVDENKSIEAILSPSEAGVLNYSSADDSIAEVDSTGKLTGVKVGTTEITITYEGSYKYLPKTVVATVNVIYVPTQIKVNKTVGLQVTNVSDLEAIVIDSTGAEVPESAANVTYTSSNSSIVKVENGVITALAAGNATITIEYGGNNKYANCTETVLVMVHKGEIPTEIIVNETIDMYVKDIRNIEAEIVPANAGKGNLVYQSNDESIVTVDDEGNIHALKTGTTTIFISFPGNDLYNASNATVTVNVSKIPIEISVDNTSITMDFKQTDNVNASVNHPEAGKLRYSSNNTAAVTVDQNGKIIAVGAGNATITIAFDGNENYTSDVVTVDVTVKKVASSVWLNKESIAINYGRSGAAIVYVDGGTVGLDNIEVVDHPEATILFDGRKVTVYGLDVGNYTLKINTVPDGNHYSVEENFNVAVKKVASILNLNKDNIIINYGRSGAAIISVAGGTVGLDNIEVVDHPEAKIKLSGHKVTVYGLDVGNYTLKINTTPDDNHYSVEKTFNVTVNKVDSFVKLNKNIIYINYGRSGAAVVSVVGGTVGVDNFEVIGHPEATILFSGNKVTIYGLDVGNYTLKVNTTPDDNHYSVEKTVDVVVNKVNSTIKFSRNITFNLGSSGSTLVTVRGASIELSNIEVVGHPEARIVLNDNKITVSKLSGGNYTLKVTTTPDDNHLPVVGTVDIKVITVSTSVDVPLKNISMKVGDTDNVNATLNPSEAGNLTYTSSNQDVVTVDSTGKITAVGEGQAKITIKFKAKGKYLYSENSVTVNVSRIATSIGAPDKISLYVDDVCNVNASIDKSDSGIALSYSVDDGSIISVDKNGIITAKNEGTAKINVSFGGNYKYLPSQRIVNVTVSRIPTEVTVQNTTIEMEVGYGMTLKPTLKPSNIGNLVYESSDSDTVEVDNNGFVFTVKSGSANVTISYEGDYKYKPSNVTVSIISKPRVTNITVKDNVELVFGDSVNLNATLNFPSMNDKLQYSSSRPAVVSVDQNGQITALNSGNAKITVKFNETSAFTGSSAEVMVTVKPKETQLVVDPDYVSLNANEKKSINATLKNGPSGAKLTYASSNADVATVDKYGKITAVGKGDAVITVSYAGNANYVGSTANVTVNVSSIPTQINVNESVSMFVDQTANLNATLSPNAGALTYSSSNSAVVKVDSSGKLTAVKKGSAVISISYDGNNKYDPSAKNVTVTVSRIPTYIDVNKSITIEVDEVENLNAVLSPNVGTLTYTSSNSAVVNVDADGNITGLKSGTATISIKYIESAKYLKSTASVKVKVVKIDLNNVEGVVFDVSPQETATPSYSIVIPEDATGTLNVVIDGNKTYSANVVNGKATVDVPELAKGEHTVTVTYSGNYKYLGLNKSSVVSNPVYKIDKNKDVYMADGGNGTYIVHLTKNTQAVEGKSIKFVINDETVKYAQTDSLGYAMITFSDLPLSTTPYNITAEYADVKVSNLVYVKESLTPEEASYNQLYKLDKNSNVVMTYGSTATYSVRLTEDSMPLQGKTITFTINGGIVGQIMTDISGYARLTISDLAASSTPYTITAEYANVKVTNKIYVK